PGLRVFLTNPPPIRMGGALKGGSYQYTLQSLDNDILQASALRLEDAMTKAPIFSDVTSDFDAATPAVTVNVDRDRAAALGVSVQQIETALGAAFGGQQVSTIYEATDQFPVILEVQDAYQRDANGLSRLYLSGQNGTLVPLSTVTRIGRGSMA